MPGKAAQRNHRIARPLPGIRVRLRKQYSSVGCAVVIIMKAELLHMQQRVDILLVFCTAAETLLLGRRAEELT
jgi:hypothetical protein